MSKRALTTLKRQKELLKTLMNQRPKWSTLAIDSSVVLRQSYGSELNLVSPQSLASAAINVRELIVVLLSSQTEQQCLGAD